MRARVYLLSLIILTIMGIGLYYLSFSYFKAEEIRKAQGRLALYESSLSSQIERFSYFPYVLSQDPYVIAAALGKGDGRLSERLAEFTRQSGVETIYLMDTTGLTIATSNFDQPTSYLGQSYAFRPYFKQALAGNHGEFYGIGATTNLPGLFISEPVRNDSGKIIGVIALKLNFGKLEAIWANAGEQILLSNRDGVILLSSNANWRYRTLYPISNERRASIKQERQFANHPLNELNWKGWGGNQAMIEGTYYLLVRVPLQSRKWSLYFFASERPVQEKTWLTLISAAIIITLLFAWTQMRRTTTIGAALRQSQADSADLREANRRLAVEIEERRTAEKQLERTQDELARTSRLAALGQLSVSVTHELGQPLSAMRNYITAAELSPAPKNEKLLGKLTSLTLRMENITKQLKFFAKAGTDTFEPVDLRDVVKEVEELLSSMFISFNVTCTIEQPHQPVLVRANKLRLEQVLTNIMRNGVDAMKDCSERMLNIHIYQDEKTAYIDVKDSGAGIGGATMEDLQEPFYTTRASGEGMGLGLSISSEIIKEHAGHIAARNHETGGALFSISLPLNNPNRED